MATPFIGQITLFAGNFAPRGWAFCQGQILSIAQNSALFSILGITYGGNGQTTFALPDLRGRVPVQQGQGPGLSNYNLGDVGGTESVVLNTTQLPAHVHAINLPASADDATTESPIGSNLAPAVGGSYATATTTQAAGNSGIAGTSQPVSILQPSLALNYIIALEGIYPSRN